MFDDIIGPIHTEDDKILEDEFLEDEDEEIILYDASKDDGSVPTLDEVLEEVQDFFENIAKGK